MISMKKAQGLSLSTMAVAVIVLVVIVVVILIFSGVVGEVAPFLIEKTECDAQVNSGGCMNEDECIGTAIFGLCEDSSKGKYCCIKDE